MNATTISLADVPGWAIDADPKNEPTFPLRQRTEFDHAGYTWKRPAQQRTAAEILHSNERPDLSAVFGTTVPPAGVSGALRRFAFRFSESSYGHWLPLMLADRIAAFGAFIDDLLHGRVLAYFTDRGWRAEWRHNRTALIVRILLNVAVVVALVAAIAALLRTLLQSRAIA